MQIDLQFIFPAIIHLCLFLQYPVSYTSGLTMTSHNATRKAHGVMWKWIGWQRQRRTSYRVQCHNVAWCSIYECLFEHSSTTNILRCHLVHNKHLTLSSCAQQKYFSSHDSWNVRFLASFDRDMFRSKYARRVRPWSFNMLCRWRHWGRGMYLLPLLRHTRETSLSTWLPMPELHCSLLL